MSETELDLSYEDALAELEEILAALEAGDLPLEESLARYERGATLAAYCEELLDKAELRVRQWQPNGELNALESWEEQAAN